MKKITLYLAAFFMLLSGAAMASFNDHPYHGQITSFTASIKGTVNGLEQAYFVREGEYFQGLWILGDIGNAVDGTVEIPTVNTRKNNDQNASWSDFGPALYKPGLTAPINYRTDRDVTPAGEHGYYLILEFYYDGLGPDDYGNDGNHWMHIHHGGEAPANPFLIYDDWYIDADF